MKLRIFLLLFISSISTYVFSQSIDANPVKIFRGVVYLDKLRNNAGIDSVLTVDATGKTMLKKVTTVVGDTSQWNHAFRKSNSSLTNSQNGTVITLTMNQQDGTSVSTSFSVQSVNGAEGAFNQGDSLRLQNSVAVITANSDGFVYTTNNGTNYFVDLSPTFVKGVRLADSTNTLRNFINLALVTKLNTGDTLSMLLPYLRTQRFIDSLSALNVRINQRVTTDNLNALLLNYAKLDTLAPVAFNNNYNSLDNKPTIPTTTSQLINNSNFISIENDPTWNSEKGLYATVQRLLDSINSIKVLIEDRLFTKVDKTNTITINGSTQQLGNNPNFTITTSSGTFTQNIVLNGGAGNRLGYWVEGETIPVSGKTLDEAFQIITQRAIPPTYLPPTSTITGLPSPGSYEIGTSLGTIVFNATFNQRDGGAETNTSYFVNGSNFAGNSFTVNSLTSNLTFNASKSYGQGACKNNNLGVLDCTGRIQAGSVNSNSISYLPVYRRYRGWLSDTTGISTGGQDIAIRSLPLDFVANANFGTFGTGNPTGTQFYVIAYFSNYPNLSNITQNGFPSLGAYNFITRTINNAQGFPVSLKIYYSKNGQTSSSTITAN